MNTIVHTGALYQAAYQCWVECGCGWRTLDYQSEHDAWTAHQLHRDQATDEGAGGPRVPFGWQGKRRR